MKKVTLDFNPIDPYFPNKRETFTEDFLKEQIKEYCKPCWELGYCPYGVFVEQSPLPPLTREYATKHIEYLKSLIKKNSFPDGRKLKKSDKEMFQKEIDFFKKKNYPKEIPKVVKEMSCSIYGHICPVYFQAEGGVDEHGKIIHKRQNKGSRHIPRGILIRVVRRDNSMCQICKKVLLPEEIEIDHIIPFSKGGPTKEDNLRVLCESCNKKKGNKI